MKKAWIDENICYDGTQLRSHWILERTGESGDVLVAFIGPADVPLKNMVDLHDVAKGERIFSKSMLHFLVEHFDCDLRLAIARQRILTAIVADELRMNISGANLERKGDDLYDDDKKLSVSIATTSPVSTCIHFAVNIESDGTPVPTKGLCDYGIEPKRFADEVMSRYCEEIESMEVARCKVRPVP